MARTTQRITLAFCVAILASAAARHAARAGDEILVDGVPHIRNGATPPEGVVTMRLKEIWRHGGQDDETIYGQVTHVEGDEDGNVYVFDAQQTTVFVYDPKGKELRTLFREGDGPGEVRDPHGMVRLGDGSLGLLMRLPPKLVRVDREGTPLPSLAFDPGSDSLCLSFGAFACGEHVAFSILNQTQEGSTQTVHFHLATVDAEGRRKARFAGGKMTMDLAEFVFSEKEVIRDFMWRTAIGLDGRVYAAADRDHYRIDVYRQDGTLERVIERAYEPYRRSDFEFSRLKKVVESMFASAPFEVTSVVEETEPAIASWRQPSLRVDAGGDLWVLSSRGCHDQADGILHTYDVFSPAGHFLKQVAVACEGQGPYDGLFFVGGGRVIHVSRVADSMLSLVFQGVTPEIGDDEEVPPVTVRCLEIVG